MWEEGHSSPVLSLAAGGEILLHPRVDSKQLEVEGVSDGKSGHGHR
jgi:hypothetical protein